MNDIDEFLTKIAIRAQQHRHKEQSLPASINLENNSVDIDIKDEITNQSSPTSSNVTKSVITTADIAIIVALPVPELDQVLTTFSSQWSKEGREGIVFNKTQLNINGQQLTLVAAVQNEMGMVPAAILTSKAIRAWQPKIVAMTGICAGVKGKVNLGDVVVGRQVFDYGSGKLIQGRLYPDYHPVTLNEELCAYAIDLANNSHLLTSIRNSWPLKTGKPQTELNAHVGAMASGAAVVSDDSVVEGIQEHKRSLLAIDMESYGFAKAVTHSILPSISFLVIKGVQDFANESKSDEYREYAAFASTKFLYAFLEAYWR